MDEASTSSEDGKQCKLSESVPQSSSSLASSVAPATTPWRPSQLAFIPFSKCVRDDKPKSLRVVVRRPVSPS